MDTIGKKEKQPDDDYHHVFEDIWTLLDKAYKLCEQAESKVERLENENAELREDNEQLRGLVDNMTATICRRHNPETEPTKKTVNHYHMPVGQIIGTVGEVN